MTKAGAGFGAGLDAVQSALEAHGLCLRGGFDLAPGETVAVSGGDHVRSLLLVGNVGGDMWRHFRQWRLQAPEGDHPLDTWSRHIVEHIAAGVGARAVFPSDRPFLPFQQWAKRAEGLRASPLGILMHPRYGLWHAYRAALLFDREVGLAGAPAAPHACDTCIAKPCLTACPVDAYSVDGFDHATCLHHVRGADSGSCMRLGCRDRNACPRAKTWRYPIEMQRFLMSAYAG